jgi:hypothetical protein
VQLRPSDGVAAPLLVQHHLALHDAVACGVSSVPLLQQPVLVTGLCKSVLEVDPGCAWAWSVVGWVALASSPLAAVAEDSLADAVTAFQQCVRLQPGMWSAWDGLARAYLGLRRLTAALKARHYRVGPSLCVKRSFELAFSSPLLSLPLPPVSRLPSSRSEPRLLSRALFPLAVPHAVACRSLPSPCLDVTCWTHSSCRMLCW